MRKPTFGKKVYILGAGFSYAAEIPVQSQLLKAIFRYKPGFEEAEVIDAQARMRHFMTDNFKSKDKAHLEDIFTIFDRCVLGKERFKGYNWQDLCGRREQLIFLILFTINNRIDSMTRKTKGLYKRFAQHLIKYRRRVGKGEDKLSVISLNWDTLLELSIEAQLMKLGKKDMMIDYCTYTHTLLGSGIPHTNIKAKGYYNIKILKLHGSLNWLFCSNCGRLFVDEKRNIGIEKIACTRCEQMGDASGLVLEPMIVTPTFLKELNNLHVKNIWGNALIDLQEASEVIFIGYSLPYADFEFKHLLKKSIREDASIRVVTVKKGIRNVKNSYESFFGKGRVEFYDKGWEAWVKSAV